MKKLISLVLLTDILMSTFVLTSCQWFFNHGKQEGEYYAVKTLYSYEDVTAALDIVRQKYDIEPVYTVDYSGEDFTVFYHFVTPGHKTEYPIDYNTYFNEKSYGTFITYIFFENKSCTAHKDSDGHYRGSTIHAYEGDEDYEKLVEYRRYARVIIEEKMSVVEIEDRSKLHYKQQHFNNFITYKICYDEKEIMNISSCVELDETFMETFFEHLVVI